MNLLPASFLNDRALRHALLDTAESRVVALDGKRFAPEAFDVHVTDSRLCRLSALPGELEASLLRHLRDGYRRRGWMTRGEISVHVRFEPTAEHPAGFAITVC